MSKEILNQAGKITATVLCVTGGVCSKLEHSRIKGKIYQPLFACLLSKNALVHKQPSTFAPCILGDQSLPTT